MSAELPSSALLDWSHTLSVLYQIDQSLGQSAPGYFHPFYRRSDLPYFDDFANNVAVRLSDLESDFGLDRGLHARYFQACCKPDFALASRRNLHQTLNSLIGSEADSERYVEKCFLFPRRRIRPLYTYPVEERDGVPRLRPLLNTAIIIADADRLYADDPERFVRLVNHIRAEPTCRVFYFLSDFYASQAPMVTVCLESLCLPQPTTRVDVEAYDVHSEAWVTAHVVGEENKTLRLQLGGTGSSGGKVRVISSELIRRAPARVGSVTTPALLSRFVFDHKITVSVMFPTPVMPHRSANTTTTATAAAAAAAAATSGSGGGGASVPATPPPPPPTAEERYANAAATNEDPTPLALRPAIEFKLDLIGRSVVSNAFGKHLVVTHAGAECVQAAANVILQHRTKNTAAYPEISRGLQAWQPDRDAFPSRSEVRVLCLLPTVEAARAALVQTTERLRRVTAFVISKPVFAEVGLFHRFGIRHVYLMDHTVRVSVFHASTAAQGSLMVLHVWDYVVRSVPGRNSDFPSQQQKKMAPFVRTPSGDSLGRALREMATRQAGAHVSAFGLLDDIVRQERNLFGARYETYLSTGASMDFVVKQLRATDSGSFDPSRILRTCQKWRLRNDIGEERYTKVLTAVQNIFGSDLFQAYNRRRIQRQCGTVVQLMRVNAVLLYNISAELGDVEEMLQILATDQQLRRLAPGYALRVVVTGRGGAVQNLLATANGAADRLAVVDFLRHVEAKVSMLDRMRSLLLGRQQELWSQLLACHSLQSVRYFSFQPVGCQTARSRALQVANRFQQEAPRLMSPHRDDKLVGTPLLFGVVERDGLAGGGGGFTWGMQSPVFARRRRQNVRGGAWINPWNLFKSKAAKPVVAVTPKQDSAKKVLVPTDKSKAAKPDPAKKAQVPTDASMQLALDRLDNARGKFQEFCRETTDRDLCKSNIGCHIQYGACRPTQTQTPITVDSAEQLAARLETDLGVFRQKRETFRSARVEEQKAAVARNKTRGEFIKLKNGLEIAQQRLTQACDKLDLIDDECAHLVNKKPNSIEEIQQVMGYIADKQKYIKTMLLKNTKEAETQRKLKQNCGELGENVCKTAEIAQICKTTYTSDDILSNSEDFSMCIANNDDPSTTASQKLELLNQMLAQNKKLEDERETWANATQGLQEECAKATTELGCQVDDSCKWGWTSSSFSRKCYMNPHLSTATATQATERVNGHQEKREAITKRHRVVVDRADALKARCKGNNEKDCNADFNCKYTKGWGIYDPCEPKLKKYIDKLRKTTPKNNEELTKFETSIQLAIQEKSPALPEQKRAVNTTVKASAGLQVATPKLAHVPREVYELQQLRHKKAKLKKNLQIALDNNNANEIKKAKAELKAFTGEGVTWRGSLTNAIKRHTFDGQTLKELEEKHKSLREDTGKALTNTKNNFEAIERVKVCLNNGGDYVDCQSRMAPDDFAMNGVVERATAVIKQCKDATIKAEKVLDQNAERPLLNKLRERVARVLIFLLQLRAAQQQARVIHVQHISLKNLLKLQKSATYLTERAAFHSDAEAQIATVQDDTALIDNLRSLLRDVGAETHTRFAETQIRSRISGIDAVLEDTVRPEKANLEAEIIRLRSRLRDIDASGAFISSGAKAKMEKSLKENEERVKKVSKKEYDLGSKITEVLRDAAKSMDTKLDPVTSGKISSTSTSAGVSSSTSAGVNSSTRLRDAAERKWKEPDWLSLASRSAADRSAEDKRRQRLRQVSKEFTKYEKDKLVKRLAYRPALLVDEDDDDVMLLDQYGAASAIRGDRGEDMDGEGDSPEDVGRRLLDSLAGHVGLGTLQTSDQNAAHDRQRVLRVVEKLMRGLRIAPLYPTQKLVWVRSNNRRILSYTLSASEEALKEWEEEADYKRKQATQMIKSEQYMEKTKKKADEQKKYNSWFRQIWKLGSTIGATAVISYLIATSFAIITGVWLAIPVGLVGLALMPGTVSGLMDATGWSATKVKNMSNAFLQKIRNKLPKERVQEVEEIIEKIKSHQQQLDELPKDAAVEEREEVEEELNKAKVDLIIYKSFLENEKKEMSPGDRAKIEQVMEEHEDEMKEHKNMLSGGGGSIDAFLRNILDAQAEAEDDLGQAVISLPLLRLPQSGGDNTTQRLVLPEDPAAALGALTALWERGYVFDPAVKGGPQQAVLVEAVREQTSADREREYLSVLVNLSRDCRCDQDHKKKLLKNHYKCDNNSTNSSQQDNRKRHRRTVVYDHSIFHKQNYATYFWNIGNTVDMRLHVFRFA